MGTFDAELYLRLAGEEMLLEQRESGRRTNALVAPARALVAVGAIALAAAEAIIEEYGLARALRNENEARHRAAFRAHAQSSQPKPLAPRRVVPCDRTIEQPQGTLSVRYVVLAVDRTTVAVRWREAAPGPSVVVGMRSFGHAPSHGPGNVTLRDDRGTTAQGSFSGGGSPESWEGEFTAHSPLSPDTTWIEIDGVRVDMTGQAAPTEVSIEALEEERPAHRYLWRLLTARDHHFHHEPEALELSIEALIAAGALAPDDPVIGEVRSVAESIVPHHRPPPATPSSQTPEPWRSMLRRRSSAGARGSLTLGAVTPEFDGFSVAALELDAHADGFGIEVEVAPAPEHDHGPWPTGIEMRRLAWWARDDIGNHYLGSFGRWSGGDGHATGRLEFWPLLDPKATRLDFMPTAERTRAVIRIPLPWAGQ